MYFFFFSLCVCFLSLFLAVNVVSSVYARRRHWSSVFFFLFNPVDQLLRCTEPFFLPFALHNKKRWVSLELVFYFLCSSFLLHCWPRITSSTLFLLPLTYMAFTVSNYASFKYFFFFCFSSLRYWLIMMTVAYTVCEAWGAVPAKL